MGVFTYETEVATPVTPAKMFKALILDSDNLISKIMPKAIQSVEILEGNGGPGTIKKITFSEVSQIKYVKHKIESVDEENLTYSYSIIEGDALMNMLEKITYETKLVSAPDGGCICKSTSKYFTIGDKEINEEKLKAGKEKALGTFKAIEAYLLANPDEYN